MHQFAYRCALGAMGAAIDRAVPCGFLTDPDAVLHFGSDRTPNRTMGANILANFNRRGAVDRTGFGLANSTELDRADGGNTAKRKSGLGQERTSIEHTGRQAVVHGLQTGAGGFTAFAFDQHGRFPQYRLVL